MLRRIILTVLIITLALLSIFFTSNWLNPFSRVAMDSTDHKGQFDVGTRFGIDIGEDVGSVNQKLLKNGLKYDEFATTFNNNTTPKNCHGYTYAESDEIIIYVDDSWRSVIVCIISKENRLIAMSWFFQPGAP